MHLQRPHQQMLDLLLCLLVLAFLTAMACAHVGCTQDQEQQFAQKHPGFAPATQAVESAERGIDKGAQIIVRVAPQVGAVADTGVAIGVPYSEWVKFGVAGLASLASAWIARRGPMKALTQTVQGIENAGGAGEQLGQHLAAAQDADVKRLVSSIKG